MNFKKILSCSLAVVMGLTNIAPAMSYAADLVVQKKFNDSSFTDYYNEWKMSLSDKYKVEDISGIMAGLSAAGGGSRY